MVMSIPDGLFLELSNSVACLFAITFCTVSHLFWTESVSRVVVLFYLVVGLVEPGFEDMSLNTVFLVFMDFDTFRNVGVTQKGYAFVNLC